VQGPLATRMLQPLTTMDLAGMKYYTFAKGRFADVENVLVSATGYTGSGGVEIYFENKPGYADRIWEAILTAGRPQGLVPVGLGARDTLRMEKGFCLYGNDIDDTTTPLEAGLGWITKFGKVFTARDILEVQKKRGVSRKLVGFEVDDRAIPRHGYVITDGRGNQIGTVTSGTHSPCLEKPIGMGYLATPLAAPGTEISILVRGREVSARVVRFPFL
jgi:aminomethyltransferase